MTRAECEIRVLDLMRQITDTVHKYDKECQYISATYLDGHISVYSIETELDAIAFTNGDRKINGEYIGCAK